MFDGFQLETPCIGVCKKDQNGICIGCFRTENERYRWKDLDLQQREEVLKQCHIRREQAGIVIK
ncbi:DUF1289 domain-containing protein [Vibrio sp. SS-MA-C1-2]|uniref:DUF1289 domain-containing protein n=1 Tax=Vibrio sp. SS-MA-C1-2 TaxID=2908646 RepID=UPI001F17B2EA|nr:DUF1289 domain-containing protein [Vibrio sp. SS-MA-C1-2]UJF20055.1 DUF1289 domain-containing protein [Vibrio sp. SS-MA-C1-2]